MKTEWIKLKDEILKLKNERSYNVIIDKYETTPVSSI